jgi:hypothetical protein
MQVLRIWLIGKVGAIRGVKAIAVVTDILMAITPIHHCTARCVGESDFSDWSGGQAPGLSILVNVPSQRMVASTPNKFVF